MGQKIKSGDICDQAELLALVNSPNLAYEHLDWFPTKSRLAEKSTFCLFSPDQLEAILCVKPEIQDFAWIRFYITHRDGKHKNKFDQLFNHAISWLKDQAIPHLYSLASSVWFENLLTEHGFVVQNQLISLGTNQISGTKTHTHTPILVRPMRLGDLPEINQLDSVCFSAPWQLNQASMEKCYLSGAYASVASVEGNPIAYQVTNQFLNHLHLARVAVHPDWQGQGIAKALLFDMAEYFENSGCESISVNTQVDNLASLGLYTSLGFRQEDCLIPVYCFDLT